MVSGGCIISGALYRSLLFSEVRVHSYSHVNWSVLLPRVEVGHEETVSPLNALGTKGAGEAGAIPVGALFAQAVEDALAIPGLEILEIPLKPGRLWELVHKAG